LIHSSQQAGWNGNWDWPFAGMIVERHGGNFPRLSDARMARGSNSFWPVGLSDTADPKATE